MQQVWLEILPMKFSMNQKKYHGLDVYHPYFFQEIIHIMILIQEYVFQSQKGILLLVNSEAFRGKIGILFLLTGTKYNVKTFAFYVNDG